MIDQAGFEIMDGEYQGLDGEVDEEVDSAMVVEVDGDV